MNDPICRLCLMKNEQVNSHIIPEFLYKNAYDEKHRALKISSDPNENEQYEQKGIREKLLCESCEGRISRFEDYGAKIIRRINDENDNPNDEMQVIKQVDYRKFKLFGISILWRASVSINEFFKDVSLGTHQEEKIRYRLLTENPGKYFDFGLFLMQTRNPRYLDKLILSPKKMNFEGFDFFTFPISGILWSFIADRHSYRFPYQKFFFSHNGELHIYYSENAESQFVSMISKVFLNKKDNS